MPQELISSISTRRGRLWADRARRFSDGWARLFHRTGLRAPNVLGIFRDRTVTRELARSCDVEDDLLRPFVRLAVEVAELPVGLKVGGQIGQVHELIAVGQECATERLEEFRLILTGVIRKDQIERPSGFLLNFLVPV